MKNGFSFLVGIGMSATFLITMPGCSKNQAVGSNSSDSTISSTSTSSSIAVATDSAGTDSVYIIQHCGFGNYRDTIAASALPAPVTRYLDSAYAGYSSIADYEIKNGSGAVQGYVAIVRYNGIPVGVLFNSNGSFDKVLEQREAGDLNGHGYHHGGRYGNRDGHQRDSVALANLPAAISSWFGSNFPNDTLLKAYKNIDSSYLVISQDNGLYSSLFSAGGTLLSRTQVHVRHSKFSPADETALPASVSAYLMDTYSGFVFDKAFTYTENGALAGYIVFIDANNSKYSVEFDASGKWIGAVTLF